MTNTVPPAYLIGNFSVINPEKMSEYVQQALPLVKEYGGQALVSDQKLSPVEGKAKNILVVISFPSLEQAQSFYHCDAYAPLKQLRIEATEGGFTSISEGLPLA
ncbi:DUF1330 domain-containing protein [Neokomagataea anthophila]|uniref:DUF1330 domain-containing protein n=1 Tax=Neokomagataea anthophila TaxID=2826925 RepID=A0ABS5E9I5_9PROT|nr:DUF1330 domain-containing protein [Neokomagataea anthophila]MBR0560565.1 DUF1330 domain-containing protein [Neokomagataea anthophila]